MNRDKNTNSSRRKFLYNLGMAGLSIPLISANSKCHNEKENPQTMTNKQAGKLGIALVGLGSYASGQLAPALLKTEHCYLAGIVTGTPSKAETWKEKYNIPEKNIYNYDNYDSIKDNPDIDIIYVVLPNSLHADFTIRGAKAGKHIICEKPMAITVEDCDKMIKACKKAGKMLSIGYRLHFDPFHLEMVRLGTQNIYGDIKKMNAGFSFVSPKNVWRLNKKLSGGGPLMDLGIYCLQGVMYITGMKPVAVTAQSAPISDKEKFVDIEETLKFQLEMPTGLMADCKTSYSENMNILRAEAENGWFELQPAFNYSGLKGKTIAGMMEYPALSQQAKQMDDFALAIKNKRLSPVPGEMGKRDMKIITAIYEAMTTGKRIEIKK